MDTQSLSVDIGTLRWVAVCTWPSGPMMPLHVDGLAYLPGLVHIGADAVMTTGVQARDAPPGTGVLVTGVAGRIAKPPIQVDGRDIDPVDVVAALLRRLAHEAQSTTGATIASLRVAVPAAWGPRRYALLSAAAERAGLPRPSMVPAPVAAAVYATHTGEVTVPVGGMLLLCDLGASAVTATVLARVSDLDWDILSTLSDPDGGGDHLDTLLTDALTAPAPDTSATVIDAEQVRDAVRTAKEALTHTPRTPVALPPQYPATVLTRDTLTDICTPLLTHISDTVTRAIEVADVTADDMSVLVCVGGGAHLPNLATSLHTSTGITTRCIPRPEQVVALGTARIGRAGEVRPAGEWVRSPAPDGIMRQLLFVLCAAAGSMLLLIEVLKTAYLHTYGYNVDFILIDTSAFAVGCALIMLTAISAARLYALNHLAAPPGTRIRDHIPRPSRIFWSAAGIGVVVAIIYGLLAGTVLHWPSGAYVATAVKTTVPLAAITATIGVLTPRLAYLGGSAFNHLRHPVTGLVLGVTGVAFLDSAGYVPHFHTPQEILEHGGGALVGAACAWTLTRHHLPRLITITLLATTGALVASGNTNHLLGYAYLTCMYVWWLQALGATILDAYPNLRGLVHRQRTRTAHRPEPTQAT